MGPGPTLLGTPDTGLDDATFDRFVRESFSPETARGIPGLGETDPDRFAVRSRYLAGVGRMPWLTWRSRAIASLYTELAEAAQAAAPGSVLAVVTPGLDDGPAGTEARRVDRAGLAPSQAWRSVGLDLQAWPSTPAAPPVFRGVVLSTDALGHDLATSPDLDALVAGRAQRGLLLTIHDDPPALSGPAGPAHLTEEPPNPAPSSTSIASPAVVRSGSIGARGARHSGPERQPASEHPRGLADGLAARATVRPPTSRWDTRSPPWMHGGSSSRTRPSPVKRNGFAASPAFFALYPPGRRFLSMLRPIPIPSLSASRSAA